MSSTLMTMDEIINYIDSMSENTVFDDSTIKFIKSKHPNFTKKDRDKLLLHISKYVENGYLITLNSIKVYSIWNADEAVCESRKKGVFRYKVWREKNYAKIIIESLINSRKWFNYSNSTLSFLTNKLKLSWLYDYYIDAENRILKGLRKMNGNRMIKKNNMKIEIEESIVIDLLVYIEDWFDKDKADVYGKYDDLSGYSKEQISESVSYLLFLLINKIDKKVPNVCVVNPKTVDSYDLKKLVLLGCKVCQVNEWEVMVDFFNYNVKELAPNNFCIQANDPNFEKSYRLAYISQNSQHFFVSQKIVSKNKSVSIFDVCDYYIKNSKIKYKLMKEYEIKRLAINFSYELINNLNAINDQHMYLEEIIAIRQFSHDYTDNEKELMCRKVSAHCTLYDVIKFQRLFIFLSYLITYFLSNESRNFVINSILPRFSKEALEKLLMIVFLDKNKVSEIIMLFTPSFDKKLDLQYTPLFSFNDCYFIPMSLTAKSNLIRNCIASSRSQGCQKANIMDEPMVDRCRKIFQKCTLNPVVLANKPVKYKNQKGELDVLVVTENCIIIIECKCPLYPVNNFEMRGVYNHLQKATKQLDMWQQAFLDINYQKQKLKDWNITYKKRQVLTCIVFGSRLFNGLTFNGHPVRFINELDNFITRGNIRTENNAYRVWSSDFLTEKDIIDFLSEKSVVTQFRFDAMIESKECIKLNGIRLQFESFVTSQEKMEYQLEKNFELMKE